jgi:uncharacterized protein (DUF1501 family)
MTTFRNTEPKGLTRRNALRTLGGCAAMTQTSLLSTLLTMNLTRAAAAAVDTSGYKAMVCCFLHGGIDSFNLCIPTDPLAFEDYKLARGDLALQDLLGDPDPGLHNIIDDPLKGGDGRAYGLHPGFGGLQQLYNDGNLTFVANVGSLVEPVGDASNYRDYRLPLGLFSHSDQQRHWMTSTPQSRTQITGWAGRMADVLDDLTNRNPAIPMNIAVDYLNIFQTGDTIVPYVVDDRNGAEVFAANHSTNKADIILASATNSFLDQTYSDLVKRTFADLNAQAIEAAENYNLYTGAVTTPLGLRDPAIPAEIEAQIPYLNPIIANILQNQTGHIGRQLLQVAKAIGARVGLDQDRQVFFVERHGWDHHTSLIANQGTMVPELGNALAAFYQAIDQFGIADDVVTFTASDFARTLGANSNIGSDHAWGANHIAMGGGVNGGRLFGTYPDSLAPGNNLDLGRGRLIPTTSVDEFIADLVLWFGMENDSVLETIIPNIRNFYASSETTPPLGRML